MSTKKRQRIKITKENFGELLVQGMEESVSHAKGKITLKSETIELPLAPPKYSKTKVKKIRESLKMSQPVFAIVLGISPDTIKSWEYGSSSPNGPARRILQIIEKDPQSYLKLIA